MFISRNQTELDPLVKKYLMEGTTASPAIEDMIALVKIRNSLMPHPNLKGKMNKNVLYLFSDHVKALRGERMAANPAYYMLAAPQKITDAEAKEYLQKLFKECPEAKNYGMVTKRSKLLPIKTVSDFYHTLRLIHAYDAMSRGANQTEHDPGPAN